MFYVFFNSDEEGKNPLYHAIKKDGRADVIKTLIKNNCDVNNRDLREKRMPLAATIMNAKEDIVTYSKLLLEAGANPNVCDNFGYTPMTSLIKRGFRDKQHVDDKHMQVAELLVAHGHDLNLKVFELKYHFQYSGTSLMMAAERDCPALVHFLLKNHANPDVADFRGMTPLHIAASENHLEVVKLLIAANASLNLAAEVRLDGHSSDSMPLTPIKYAIYNHSKEAAQLLLAVGSHVIPMDYLWCDINAPDMLQNRLHPLLYTSITHNRATPMSRHTPSALIHPASRVQSPMPAFIDRANPETVSNTVLTENQQADALVGMSASSRFQAYFAHVATRSNIQGFINRFNTESGSNQPDVDVVGDGRDVNELERLLSAAVCYPPTLFRQALGKLRKSLGQPYWYRLRCLLEWPALVDVVPKHKLQQWLLASDVTGITDVTDVTDVTCVLNDSTVQ